VVGHTDNAGALDHNLKLSADRAEAVVKSLIGRGIAASRLKAAGVGPYCPVASNHTEEGKAKNRRVELVEQK
jgi:outer membrane protein OmpA-like peptidoglycan-associated protein